MNGRRSGGARAHRGLAFVFSAGARKGLFDAWFDVAIGLAADGGELRDDEVAGAFEHSLFAETERLEVAEVGEILEHVGDFKDVACSHFVGEFFEAIFPILRRRVEVVAQAF